MPVSYHAMHSASTSDQRRIKITNHLIGGRLVIKHEIYIQAHHAGDDNGRPCSRLSCRLYTLEPMMLTICMMSGISPLSVPRLEPWFPHFGEILLGFAFLIGWDIGFGPRNQWLRLGFCYVSFVYIRCSYKRSPAFGLRDHHIEKNVYSGLHRSVDYAC